MPRRPRLQLAEIPLHIVQRGINREPCFFAEEATTATPIGWKKQLAIAAAPFMLTR